MKLNNRGFTMIELLMVIVVVSVLNAVALPAFLDFRKEAKIAALKQSLYSIRVGLKNQRLQAKLKCGYNGNGTELPIPAFDLLTGNILFAQGLIANDVTYSATVSGYSPAAICTAAQLPNPSDRKFVQDKLPVNPFNTGYLPNGAAVYSNIDIFWYASNTDACGELLCNLPIGLDWIMNPNTGEIFACSNTPGVNECSF